MPKKRVEFPVPVEAQSALCASCNDLIVWTEMPSGKRMPLSVKSFRLDEHGHAWAESHFSDCRFASQHRRDKQEAMEN
jgi:hypothetical protein